MNLPDRPEDGAVFPRITLTSSHSLISLIPTFSEIKVPNSTVPCH